MKPTRAQTKTTPATIATWIGLRSAADADDAMDDSAPGDGMALELAI